MDKKEVTIDPAASSGEPRIIDNFEILEEIGAGAFSTVHIARHITTGVYAAAKIVDLSRLGQHEFNGIMREISVFMQVEHPNVCSCYRMSLEGKSLILFIEYAVGGTLLSYVNKNSGLKEPEAQRIFFQIYSALRYLHNYYFLVHRDLKLENILFDANWNVKITDFGLASTSYCNIMRSYVGTPGYTPPEVIAGNDYDEKCDVWSLGVCLYAMITANLPFSTGNNYRKLIDEAENLRFPLNFSPALVDLLKRMLHVRPSSRCRLIDIQNHPWLRGVTPMMLNMAPSPIVFYQVNGYSDILKFKRRPTKPKEEIIEKCKEYNIDPEQLKKELSEGIISDNTTTYFCLLHPLMEKPSLPEKPKPKQRRERCNSTIPKKGGSASQSTKGVYKNAAALVIGAAPQKSTHHPSYY